MPNPQNQEIGRSQHNPMNQDTDDSVLAAEKFPGADEDPARTPEANLPGHHPERDQDKPDGAAFAEKMGIPTAEQG